MKTIEQLTGTEDLLPNLIAFVMLSIVIVTITSFTFLALTQGIQTF